MNGMDAFERSVRKSLEDFEVPYNSSDWARMELELSSGKRGGWSLSTGTFWLLVAGVTALAGSTYLLVNQPAETAARTGQGAILPTSFVAATEPGTVNEATTLNLATKDTDEEVRNTDIADRAPGATNASSATAVNARTTAARSVKDPVQPSGIIPSAPESRSAPGFRTSISEGCEGASVEFKVENMPESGIYLWNFGDGNFSNKPNPTHTFTKPGKFTVTLSMSASGISTITNEPFTDMVVINEAPLAAFNPMKQEYSGHVPFVHFENRSLGSTRYHWDFGDGTTSSVAHPDHVYRKKGEYRVQLMVMNEVGCTDFLERMVRIDSDYNLLAPAVFSPNGDGQADTFMPEALKDLNVRFKLSVYEPTTGRLVYETTDATKPWTGRMLNRGDVCIAGEYVWMAEIQEGLHLGGVNFEGKVSLVK